MELSVVLTVEEGVLTRVDHVVEHRGCLAVLTLEEVGLAQQSLCQLLGDTDAGLLVVGAALRGQCARVDGLCQVLLHESPGVGRIAVGLTVLVLCQQMIHLRSGAPETDEFEVCPGTEHLGFVDGAFHHSRLTLCLVDDQVGVVNDCIKAGVETLDGTVVGVEVILIELLHLTVVLTLSASTPYIVGEQVLGEVPGEVKRSY